MVRIAITGGIACGKSRVASYLQTRGIAVCDADMIAHRALDSGGAAYGDIVRTFGSGVLDDAGEVDRRKLGDIVFTEPGKLTELNRLVHPAVKVEIEAWLNAQQRAECPMAVVVVPLLFEAEMADGWDAVICVGCSPSVQQTRLMARGFDAEACRQRVDAQMPLIEKMERSDFEIWNDGSEEQLEERVGDVLRSIQERT
jgi:dephospho-CoA kinase